jgi:hypothetical protein
MQNLLVFIFITPKRILSFHSIAHFMRKLTVLIWNLARASPRVGGILPVAWPHRAQWRKPLVAPRAIYATSPEGLERCMRELLEYPGALREGRTRPLVGALEFASEAREPKA